MKGILFNALEEMVIAYAGIPLWNQLLSDTPLQQEGIYTAGGDYPAADLTALLQQLAPTLGLAEEDLQQQFGAFLFEFLSQRHPDFLHRYEDLADCLTCLDRLYEQINRRYSHAGLPTFQLQPASDHFTLALQVSAPQAQICQGLLKQAASHFQTPLQLQLSPAADQYFAFAMRFQHD